MAARVESGDGGSVTEWGAESLSEGRTVIQVMRNEVGKWKNFSKGGRQFVAKPGSMAILSVLVPVKHSVQSARRE